MAVSTNARGRLPAGAPGASSVPRVGVAAGVKTAARGVPAWRRAGGAGARVRCAPRP